MRDDFSENVPRDMKTARLSGGAGMGFVCT